MPIIRLAFFRLAPERGRVIKLSTHFGIDIAHDVAAVHRADARELRRGYRTGGRTPSWSWLTEPRQTAASGAAVSGVEECPRAPVATGWRSDCVRWPHAIRHSRDLRHQR